MEQMPTKQQLLKRKWELSQAILADTEIIKRLEAKKNGSVAPIATETDPTAPSEEYKKKLAERLDTIGEEESKKIDAKLDALYEKTEQQFDEIKLGEMSSEALPMLDMVKNARQKYLEAKNKSTDGFLGKLGFGERHDKEKEEYREIQEFYINSLNKWGGDVTQFLLDEFEQIRNFEVANSKLPEKIVGRIDSDIQLCLKNGAIDTLMEAAVKENMSEPFELEKMAEIAPRKTTERIGQLKKLVTQAVLARALPMLTKKEFGEYEILMKKEDKEPEALLQFLREKIHGFGIIVAEEARTVNNQMARSLEQNSSVVENFPREPRVQAKPASEKPAATAAQAEPEPQTSTEETEPDNSDEDSDENSVEQENIVLDKLEQPIIKAFWQIYESKGPEGATLRAEMGDLKDKKSSEIEVTEKVLEVIKNWTKKREYRKVEGVSEGKWYTFGEIAGQDLHTRSEAWKAQELKEAKEKAHAEKIAEQKKVIEFKRKYQKKINDLVSQYGYSAEVESLIKDYLKNPNLYLFVTKDNKITWGAPE